MRRDIEQTVNDFLFAQQYLPFGNDYGSGFMRGDGWDYLGIQGIERPDGSGGDYYLPQQDNEP